LLACASTARLRVVGVAAERDGRRSLLAANLQANRLAVRLEGLPTRVTLRRLNDETAPDWSEPQALEGLSTLELGAFETVRIDV
jgi:hypothetical protein